MVAKTTAQRQKKYRERQRAKANGTYNAAYLEKDKEDKKKAKEIPMKMLSKDEQIKRRAQTNKRVARHREKKKSEERLAASLQTLLPEQVHTAAQCFQTAYAGTQQTDRQADKQVPSDENERPFAKAKDTYNVAYLEKDKERKQNAKEVELKKRRAQTKKRVARHRERKTIEKRLAASLQTLLPEQVHTAAQCFQTTYADTQQTDRQVLIDENERPFTCSHCKQNFEYKSALMSHLFEMHIRTTPSEGCNKCSNLDTYQAICNAQEELSLYLSDLMQSEASEAYLNDENSENNNAHYFTIKKEEID